MRSNIHILVHFLPKVRSNINMSKQFRAQDAAQHLYHYLTNFALIIWSVNKLMRPTLVLLYTVEQITCEDYLRFSNGYPWRNTLKDEQKCVEKQRKACH